MKKNLLVAVMSVSALTLLSGCWKCCKKDEQQVTQIDTDTTTVADETSVDEGTRDTAPEEEAK